MTLGYAQEEKINDNLPRHCSRSRDTHTRVHLIYAQMHGALYGALVITFLVLVNAKVLIII